MKIGLGIAVAGIAAAFACTVIARNTSFMLGLALLFFVFNLIFIQIL